MYQGYTDNAQGIPPLHFELASISSVPFMQSVVNILVKEKVTSIGCNEQEVGMLHDFLVQPNSISLEQVFRIAGDNAQLLYVGSISIAKCYIRQNEDYIWLLE